MTRKKLYSKWHLTLALFALVVVNTSCTEDDDDSDDVIGNWIERSDFEGVPRSSAVSFSIGDYGYVATGYDGDDRLDDIWEYDVDRDTWLQKANFPGVARNSAVAFNSGGKGYVGLGYDGLNKLNDFYSFDPETNTWETIAEFGGSARYGAIALSIDGKGYVGSGYDGNYLKDFWQYDVGADSWVQKVSIGGSKRCYAVAFAIDGKGYVCGGVDNGEYDDGFYEYDSSTDRWTELNAISDASDEDFDDEYTSITGTNKVGFTLNGKGYVGLAGQSGTSSVIWEYDPIVDLWEIKTSMEGTARLEAVAFVASNRAYITTGRNSSYYFDDIWEFEPDEEYDEYD